MRSIIFLVLCLFPLSIFAQKETLSSPDGNYLFTFEKSGGRLWYHVEYKGKAVVLMSELGVDIDNHLVEKAMGIPTDSAKVWTEDLALSSTDRIEKDTVWHPLYGEYNVIPDHYRQMVLHFKKGGNSGNAHDGGYDKRKVYELDIVVRAYNEGVAFRYHFPEAQNGLFMHITDDRTTFRMPSDTKGFFTAWAQGPYQLVPLRDWKEQSERPLYMELANGLQVAIGEAALKDFSRGKFELRRENELHLKLFDTCDIITAYDMPWRWIMVGERPVDLINHKQMVLNLNAPSQYESQPQLNTFIYPGKAIRSCKLEKKWILACIDFAASFGLQYVELDAGWYGSEWKVSSSALAVASNRDFEMQNIIQYAHSKGVGIWLYVNQRALYYQLDQILPLYKKWGVSGIKFGFVQVGSQQWTTWLHNAVAKCAEYGLMVDIHDEYRPTGISRTFPNLLTQEGIGGNEEMPDATHNTILPFTRFLCGPADYTLCYFNDRVKNTFGHQLAMAAVYYSPLQFMFWYDLPTAYQGEKELDFWKAIPTVFDESKALAGAPGEYIIQARRTGTTWYVGAMTNTQARDMTIATSDFLEKGKQYQVEIYNDDPKLKTRTRVRYQHTMIKTGKTIRLHLQSSGGAALIFKEIK